MITSKEIAQVLSIFGEKESISNVQIRPDYSVIARFESWIDPEWPYHLIVRPIKEQQVLCIYVSPLLKVPKHSDVSRKLLLLNLGLGPANLCIKPPDETLLYKIEYYYENSDGPSSEFFVWLLRQCIVGLRGVERVLFYENMVARGIPEETAEGITNTLFGDRFTTEWNHLIETKKP